jgi:hypothetical protein
MGPSSHWNGFKSISFTKGYQKKNMKFEVKTFPWAACKERKTMA